MSGLSGCYLLVACLEKRERLVVGRLGTFDFPAGHYVYTGSAMGGMEARIARHLRPEKRLRWHIDYLLEVAPVRRVFRFPTAKRMECALFGQVASLPGADIPVPRFGSGDCRCPAHLVRFGEAPEAEIERFCRIL
ncbi:MAG: GIY-YIG nuclease family protein [Armatimonadetes bacterium]|nr:GIY-YIG nuclease family protein [Armatimonadota bacterium]